jgi:hypothetical protein
VADAVSGRLRVVAPDGTISSLPVSSALALRQPARLAYHPRGWLYVADGPDRVTALSLAGMRLRSLDIAPLSKPPAKPM